MPNTETEILTLLKLALISERAQQDPKCQFTSLAHLLNERFLEHCYHRLGRDRASGMDGVTWQEYGVDKTIMRNPINHVIDADIKGFFDNVSHQWMLEFLQVRIVDPSFLLLIRRFLKAGYIDSGLLVATDQGTPQGGNLSPILSNIFLHYVLDLYYERENARRQKRHAHTFDFLGFTHFGGSSRRGKFIVGRRTSRKKFRKKSKELNLWLKRIRNYLPAKEWWPILAAKLRGHYQYYGVSGNMPGVQRFYRLALHLALKWLNRRSQRRSFSWKSFYTYLKHYPLPVPRIVHNLYTLSPVT